MTPAGQVGLEGVRPAPTTSRSLGEADPKQGQPSVGCVLHGGSIRESPRKSRLFLSFDFFTSSHWQAEGWVCSGGPLGSPTRLQPNGLLVRSPPARTQLRANLAGLRIGKRFQLRERGSALAIVTGDYRPLPCYVLC